MRGLSKMIFKRLFRPKFQDPNPQVRINAIESLNPDDVEHKSHLHELAFNDEDPRVILAALERLDSFALWSKMSEIAKLDRVKKKAQAMVEAALFSENESQISIQDKRTFIIECKNNALLEKCLKQDWVKDEDAELAFKILTKLDKPGLNKQFLLQTKNEELQAQLLDDLDDEPTLNKVIKRVSSEKIKQIANNKLQHLKLLKSKPVELEQKASLILSRLLALKDKSDYPLISKSKQQLEQEFSELQNEFSYLAELKRAELNEKFVSISDKLRSVLGQLAPEWEKQQKSQQASLKFADLEQISMPLFDEISTNLSLDAREITLGQVEAFEVRLQEVKNSLLAFVEGYHPIVSELQIRIETLFNKLNATNATLQRLPEFQHAIEKASLFLDEFEKLALPSDQSQVEASEAYLKEQKQIWKGYIDNYQSNWPANLNQRWSEQSSSWRKALKGLKEKGEKEFSRCRNKLKAIDSLIQQGKYKAAMALYQRVSQWYDELPDRYQQRLTRQFDKVRESVENLKDWQDYVAQPRKPALLKEVESLLQSQLNVDKQAAAVKRLRSEWNSLGKLHTEADEALNVAFDDAIEKAYEPCRLHYEALNAQRDQNENTKREIIEALSAMQTDALDDSTFLKTLAGFQQRWRDVGDVGFKQIEALKNAYSLALEPHKNRRQTLFDSYAEQKQLLINKATSLLEQDNVFDAVEQAKKLQSSWKGIPTGARKKDNQLWAAFREVNDKIFSRRAEVQAENKQKNNQTSDEIDELLNKVTSLITNAVDNASLDKSAEIFTQIEKLISDLPKKLQGNYTQSLEKLLIKKTAKTEQLQSQRQNRVYQNVFDILRKWNKSELPELASELPKQWRSCFLKLNKHDEGARNALTIKMEILANCESPEADRSMRQEIQYQMLANRLENGDLQNLDALLKEWISCGPLNDKDIGFISRIERLYTI